MKNVLENFIKEKVNNPKKEEIKAILDIFELKTFKKGAYFKEPFTIGKELGFICKGCVAGIIYKSNGSEITARILQEDSFVTDFISLRSNESTPIGIKCLEDVSMLVTSIQTADNLLQSNLTFNILVREHMADSALEMGQRLLLFLKGSAKERYQFILENDPDLLKKFPLQSIASMIGITPTQLSRIRNKKPE